MHHPTGHRPAAQPPTTGRRPRRPYGRVLLGRAVAVALTGVLVAGGVAEVQDRRAETAAAEAAAEVRRLEAAEQARRARVAGADAARLTGAAVGYAAMRRAEALTAAHAALQVANAVVVTASTAPDVPVGTTAPLGEAAAQLVALVVAAPPAAPPSNGASPDPASAPVTPAAVPPAAAVPDTSGTAVPPPPAVPAATPPDGSAPDGSAPDGSAPDGSASAGPSPAAAPGPHVDVTDLAGSPDLAAQTLRALDLATSAQVLAAARAVADLSVQVQATAEAAVAAATAARAAAEAARVAAEEAARAQAAALAERIAATDAAPNGQIPTELLCPAVLDPDVLLRCDAAVALDALAAAYRADTGRDLEVVSAYRSFEAQVAVKAARGGLAAEPGRSNHGRALAVDFGGFGDVGVFTAPGYLWMKEHAARWGWHHPAAMEPGGSGPLEPWHWEFGTQG